MLSRLRSPRRASRKAGHREKYEIVRDFARLKRILGPCVVFRLAAMVLLQAVKDDMTTSNPVWRIAIVAMLALVLTAFVAAYGLQDANLLSLIPPPSAATPSPAADVTPDRILSLYQSAFTAWAALLLLIPAYVFVWFRTHYSAWLAFWTVGYVAYVVHLYVSAFWFFEGDFEAMTTSSRVSAFWPGMVILVWWGVDAAIGLTKTHAKWVTIQRIIIHVLVFVLFVGGSAVKGETALIQLMGWALLGAGIGALVVSNLSRRTLT